jgi:hypothetical protein
LHCNQRILESELYSDWEAYCVMDMALTNRQTNI